jgi:hypothetical protein
MGEFELPGVEHLPLGGSFEGIIPVCGSASVCGIPENRMPDGAQVHPNLMHPSRFETDFQQTEPAADGEAPIVGDCFLSCGVDPDFRFVLRVFDTEQRASDRIAPLQFPDRYGQVFLPYPVRLQFFQQKIQTVSIFGNQEHPRGITINPVNERRGKDRSAGFGSEIVLSQLDYGHFRRFVVARMDIDFCRFVQCQD